MQNATFTQDDFGEIFYALRDRYDALNQSLKNRDRHGAIIRIEERQLARVADALTKIESAIAAAA